MQLDRARMLLDSRRPLVADRPALDSLKCEEEGGCGVTGFISSIPVTGKNIFAPSAPMRACMKC